jgi:hypothetical protein
LTWWKRDRDGTGEGFRNEKLRGRNLDLHPNQVRALEYLRRKGTEASNERIAEQLSSAFETMEAILLTVPADVRTKRPREGAWCIHEIVDHLVITNKGAVSELHDLVQGRRPQGGPIPASLLSEAPLSTPWDLLLEQLHGVHKGFLEAFKSGTNETSVTVRAPIVMVVKLEGEDGKRKPVAWLDELDWKAYSQAFRMHTLEHVEQVKRTLAALGSPTG